MVDERFFHISGTLNLDGIVALTHASAVMQNGAPADPLRRFSNVAPLDRAVATDIGFFDNTKYIDTFLTSHAGACFVRARYAERAPASMVLLITEEPYYCYALTARAFYPDPVPTAQIAPSAIVAKTATLGKNIRIDAGAVIGEHVTIGDDCWIGANTVLSDYVQIGNQTRIGALCSVSHALVGNRVILHRGIHIGQDGFGFAATRRGMVKVPQLGRVVIGDDVEIGSGTCIDRGTGPDTIIGNGSKIDNLVQIGHNVQVGKHAIIVAQCGIAGSTHIGDGAMLGGQVGISGHVRIGAGAKLAAQAGIMGDIPAGGTYGGSPAVPVKDWHRQTIALAKMSKRKEVPEDES